MPFTNPDFPGREFTTVEELKEAYSKRENIEKELESRSEEITKVVATIIPAPPELIESRVVSLEKEMEELRSQIGSSEEDPETNPVNKDNLPIGMVLQGESKGRKYTLEILAEGYLCSTGHIEPTLSAAAQKVSGNRRSGWKFWCDFYGNPIGEATGRFSKGASSVSISTADSMP